MGDPPAFPTADAMVRLRKDDDRPGLCFEGRRWSWAEVVAEAGARAAWLRDLRARLRGGPDVGRALHVGVLSENTPDYVFLLAAAALSGSVVVGLNPTRRGEQLAADVRCTDCDLVVTESPESPAAVATAALLEGVDLALAPGSPGVLCTDTAEWTHTLAPYAGLTPGGPPPQPGDLFLLIFTSGSTGDPKAVRMTQGRAARTARRMPLRRSDVLYCAMPLFHGNALNANLFPAVASGARIELRRRFSAGAWLPDVQRSGATYFNTVGRALAHLLATLPTGGDRDHHLGFVLAPESTEADKTAFAERFGVTVFDGYGSSENAIILNPAPERPGSLGRARPEDDVVVLDPDTLEECPRARLDPDGGLLNAAEAVGELVGRNVVGNFEGYYHDPDAEADRVRHGWYWSGDLAFRDGDGVFWFAGRSGDWLRVDSENFTAAPVERILQRWSGATGVAVYPVPDPRTGDQVMAALELPDDGAFDPEGFAEFLGSQPDLGPLWWPRYLRLVRHLPVTGTDKLDRRPLRTQPWDTADALWVRDGRERTYRRFTATDLHHLHDELARHGRRHLLEDRRLHQPGPDAAPAPGAGEPTRKASDA
jgi:fatty-acyl-CoA synthase